MIPPFVLYKFMIPHIVIYIKPCFVKKFTFFGNNTHKMLVPILIFYSVCDIIYSDEVYVFGGEGVYAKYIKRATDVFFAAVFLMLLCPLLLILCLLTYISLGSPVIFRQKRPGKGCKIFTLYKFRTMENDGVKPLGAFLRKYHIDELPELYNILRGDMSFVGPRPQLIEDAAFFDENIMRWQTVRPGLTGLAQSYGESALRWDIKFKYDLEYIGSVTFLTDCKIIFRTVKTVCSASAQEDDCGNYGDWLLVNRMIDREKYDEVMRETEK